VTATGLFVVAALGILLLAPVYLHRLGAGPTVFDRILGVNGFLTKTTVLLLLVGAAYDRLDMFVDIAIAYALLSFVGALAAARYFERTGTPR
jgi:multicomponent Na+:H+ antiporter subunit F